MESLQIRENLEVCGNCYQIRAKDRFWCCVHRSDLAAEAIIAAVPELQIWKTNLIAVASYVRRSALRTKLLHEIIPDARAFPKHHEVRFAQHQVQLIDAVLHNINGCKQVWQSLSTNGDRKDKAEACGFLKTWSEEQLWMTTVMGDVLEIYQTLQKQFQRDDLIMSDILTCRDSALRKFQLMQNGPYPGKREIASQLRNTSEYDSNVREGRRVSHQYVTTANRSVDEIRVEIVAAAYNFLVERLEPDQHDVISKMKKMLSAYSINEFVESGQDICKHVFPGEEGLFADGACEQWDSLYLVYLIC